jgi:multidrug transporter EmrE-like cation transporter
MKSFTLVFISVILGSIGQILLKLGMNQVGKVEVLRPIELISIFYRIFSTPLILIALIAYAVSLVFWLFVLSRLPLGVAYPLLAISYVINPVLAHIFFRENVSTYQIVGITIICLGVFIIGKGVK